MLNYDNPSALVNAFKQGAKFKLTGSRGTDKVTGLRVSGSGRRVVADTDNVSVVCNLDGSGTFKREYRLMRDESLGAMQPFPGNELLPFLQRFVTGEPAYCPKTRETVDAIVFREGELEVGLTNGLVGRISTNYRHDGTHKHDPARSLKLGTPPVVKKDVAVTVYLFESIAHPGTFNAGTIGQDIGRGYRQVGFGTVLAQGKQRG